MKKTLLVLALAVGLLLPAALFADTAAWEWTTTGIEFTNGDWNFGQVFTPTTNITVDFLEYFDPSTGMLDSHPVSSGMARPERWSHPRPSPLLRVSLPPTSSTTRLAR